MDQKREFFLLAIAVAAGAFIALFYDLFQVLLHSYFPDEEQIPAVKILSAAIAILGGILILKFYYKFPPKDKQGNS